MNSRSLSPFLISFALLFSVAMGLVTRVQAAAPAAGETLSREQVVASLSQQLAAHFKVEGELQLELLRPWIEPVPAAAPMTLTIVEFPPQLASSLLVRAKLESAGANLGEVTITARAQLWRDVWVARQPVNRGDTFDPADLDVRRVDLLRERDVLPAVAGDRSLVYARPVLAGRLLSWRDVTRRSLVRKGEVVEVAAVEGGLTVTIKGLAMQNGAAGDIVTVRNLVSKKDIPAQVVAENRVQVRF